MRTSAAVPPEGSGISFVRATPSTIVAMPIADEGNARPRSRGGGL